MQFTLRKTKAERVWPSAEVPLRQVVRKLGKGSKKGPVLGWGIAQLVERFAYTILHSKSEGSRGDTSPCIKMCSTGIETNNWEMGPHEAKMFLYSEEAAYRMGNKAFTSYTSNKGLMSSIYKDFKSWTPNGRFVPNLQLGHVTKHNFQKKKYKGWEIF